MYSTTSRRCEGGETTLDTSLHSALLYPPSTSYQGMLLCSTIFSVLLYSTGFK